MKFEKPARSIDRVFLHCSASDNPAHDDVEVIRNWHVNGNGWSDCGYHYFIQRDGNIQIGRPIERTPAAQAGHNTGSIAICCHGLSERKFTSQQFAALIELCAEINRAYESEISFHGHCEVSAKTCPVFDYRKVLGLDEDGMMRFEGNKDPGILPEPLTECPTLRLTDRGTSVKIAQLLLAKADMNVIVDGIFGHETHSAVRTFQGLRWLNVDGIIGTLTWNALIDGLY